MACLQYALQMSAQRHGSSAPSRPEMHVSTKACTAAIIHRQNPYGSSKCTPWSCRSIIPTHPKQLPSLPHIHALPKDPQQSQAHTTTSSHMLVNKLVQSKPNLNGTRRTSRQKPPQATSIAVCAHPRTPSGSHTPPACDQGHAPSWGWCQAAWWSSVAAGAAAAEPASGVPRTAACSASVGPG